MTQPSARKAAVPDEPLIEILDVAVWLGFSEHTVKKWVTRGPGHKDIVPPFIQVNGITKFRPQDVRDWLESKTVRR